MLRIEKLEINGFKSFYDPAHLTFPAALTAVVAENPQWFDLKKTRGGCENCYFVLKPDQYVTRVAELATKDGICGHYDGEELAVKNSNSFNDQYDIFTSDGYIRRQYGSYRSTCRPAWF